VRGERLIQLTGLFLREGRLGWPGGGRDDGVRLRRGVTGLDRLCRLQRGAMGGPHSNIGLSLHIMPPFRRQFADTGDEDGGLAVEGGSIGQQQRRLRDGAGEGAQAVTDRGRDGVVLLREPGPHPGEDIGEAARRRRTGVIQPLHRIDRRRSGIERIDDGLRAGACGRQIGRGDQGIAGNVDRGGMGLPHGQRRLALTGGGRDTGPGAGWPPIVDAAGDGGGGP
jgi:hypothetical protein